MYNTFGGYVKKSFKLIFEKPILFIPALMSLTITIVFALGALINFQMAGITNFHNFGSILFVILGALILIIAELFILAGKYNMIKQAVIIENVTMEDFWFGAKKYAGRIFLGGLLLFGVALVAILIFILPVILMQSGGLILFMLVLFLVGAIIVSLFVSFWATILIYEDCDIMYAFKLSFSFAKKHFGLVFVINLLKAILTGNMKSNKRNHHGSSSDIPFINKHGQSPLNTGDFFSTNSLFSAGTISGIALIITIIKAFLTLYFDVIFFEIYHDRRKSILDDNEEFDDFQIE